MGKIDKLYVYDATSEEDVDQAEGRFDEDDGVLPLPISSKANLIDRLSGLKANGWKFSRVLFQTHGAAGCIKFNGLSIWDTTIRDDFDPKGFHVLFPTYTRFYFDGCNVGEGTLGDEFMTKIGTSFLKLSGGEVIAWSNPGYGISGWVPFWGGHTIHFGTGYKIKRFKPGGILQPPVSMDDMYQTRPGQKDYVGHNF